MKKRALSLFLVLTFLLSVFMLCNTAAYAASVAQDGVTAELTTDKEVYVGGEAIAVSLKVSNNSLYVSKIKTQLNVPGGLLSAGGSLSTDPVHIPFSGNSTYNFALSVPAPTTTAATTTQAPTTTVPTTQVPTTVPSTTAQPTVPTTTVPATTVPATTVPPVTTEPTVPTTVPTTTVPVTTVPPTTAQPTVPATTVPGTTAAPTTQAPTQAPTTVPGGSGDNSDTGDISLYIYGALAIFSMAALVILSGGFKGIMKQRWFILVLCAALLVSVAGPVIVAATNEKSFEVSHTITVDGQAVTLTAKVTYELEEKFELPESGSVSVPFKAEGVSLYQLIPEKGWYTGENDGIVIDGMAASPTQRPEVTASYIDMLFGGINYKTNPNTFVAGEFDNSKIISDDGQKELLVGLTKDLASRKALEFIDYDQWIIVEIDGKLVVTGWYDNATVAAARYLYDQVAGETDKTLTLPIIGDMTGVIADAADVVPQVQVGTYMGGLDGDEDTTILRFENMDEEKFQAYAAELEEAGFALYAENKILNYGEAYNLFRTYTKGNIAVHIAYYPNAFMEADRDNLTPNELKALNTSFRPFGKEMRVVIDTTASLFTNEATNDYEDAGIVPQMHIVNLFDQVADGNNNAECIIYTLADGSFIVIDGGFAQDADLVYKSLVQLNQRDDGKIVVAAWIMSHHHNDHMGAFTAMAEKDYAKNVHIEQFIMNPTAVSYVWRNRNIPYNYSSSVLFGPEYYSHDVYAAYLENFGGTLDGGKTQLVSPHTGQRMFIRNAQVEFLNVGDEDMWPLHMDNDNDASLVFSVEFGKETETTEDDSRSLILNDSCRDTHGNTLLPLFVEMLDCDIVQVAHHGLGGPTSAIYRNMEPTVGVWCTTQSVAERNHWFDTDPSKRTGASYVLALRPDAGDDNDPVSLILMAEKYVQTLYLPYHVGDVVDKRILTDHISNAYVNENVNVAYLPDRVVNEGNYDALVAELEGYNANVAVMTNATGLTETVAQQLLADLDYTYVAHTQGNTDYMILSRYPITEEEGYIYGNEGVILKATLDVDGISVDVYATNLSEDFKEGFDELLTDHAKPAGQYWMILGNCASYDNTVSAYAPVVGGLSSTYDVYIGGDDHASVTDKKTYDDVAYSFTAVLPRFYVTEGTRSQTEEIDLMLWTVNGWGQTQNPKDVILGELKYVHPEIAVLTMVDNIKMEMDFDAIAEYTGYEYYYYVEAEVNNSAYPNRPDLSRGSVIFSDFPIDTDMEAVTVGDVTFTNKLVLEEDTADVEGRAFGRVAITINGVKTDVWFGFNASTLVQERAMIPYVEAAAEVTGRPFIVAGYRFKELSTIYAGKNVQSYMSADWQGIVVSADGHPIGEFTEYPRANIGMGDNKFMMDQVWVTFDSTEVNISFNANGGTGTMAADTSLKGFYELPANGFTAPAGKKFLGWATSKEEAEAGNVIYRLTLTGDVELFAAWTDAKNILISSSFNNFQNDASGRKYFVDYYKQNKFDIVTMNCVPPAALAGNGFAELAAEMGFAYYDAAINDANTEATVIFSNYKIVSNTSNEAGSVPPVLYVTVKIDGRLVDICCGQLTSYAQRANVASTLAANYTTGRELIVTGNLNGAYASVDSVTLSGVNLTFSKGDYSHYWTTNRFTVVSIVNDAAYMPPMASMSDPVNIVVSLPDTYKVSFDANGGTGTMTADEGNELGAYTLPECGFTAPEGKRFKGWATSKANADAGTVIRSLTVNADTTLYASWVDASKVSISSNYGGAIDALTSYYQQNFFDIITLTCASSDYGNQAKVNELKEALGFKNAVYAANGGNCAIILTDFPVVKVAENTSVATNPVLLATVTINNVPVDICLGTLNSMANRKIIQTVLSENHDSQRELILTGYVDLSTTTDNFLPLAGAELKHYSARYLQYWATPGVKCDGIVRVMGYGQTGNMDMNIQPYTVKFDGNGAAGTMADATNRNGSFALPTTTTFTAPEGKRFKGWATSKANADAGVVIRELLLKENVTLYASWVSEDDIFVSSIRGDYPGSASDPSCINVSNAKNNFISYYKRNVFDIVGITRIPNATTDADVEELRKTLGFNNAVIAHGTGSAYDAILLTNFPIVENSVQKLTNSEGGRGAVFATLNVNGRLVDILVAELHSSTIRTQVINTFLPKHTATNELIVLGDSGGTGNQLSATLLPNLSEGATNAKLSKAYSSAGIEHIASEIDEGYAYPFADGKVYDPIHVQMKVKPQTVKLMSWSVNLLGRTDAATQEVIKRVREHNPDIVGLQCAGNIGALTYTYETLLAEFGYPYSYFAPANADFSTVSSNYYYGHLILSKYPLSNKLESGFTSLSTSTKSYIGHCVADLGTTKLDLFIAFDVPSLDTGAGIYQFVQNNTAAGNDFVIFAHGNIPEKEQIAGKDVAIATNAKQTGLVVSQDNVTKTNATIQAKPDSLSSNGLIGPESHMTITVNRTFD